MIVIIDIILICIPLYFLSKVIFTLYRSGFQTKKLNEWSKFNKKMLSWAEEIKDENVKQEYLHFCIEKLMKGDVKQVMKIPIDDLKKEIIRKYSNHIPSLRSELREGKLNQILK